MAEEMPSPLRCFMLCYAVLRCVMLFCPELSWVVLGCAVLCEALLGSVHQMFAYVGADCELVGNLSGTATPSTINVPTLSSPWVPRLPPFLLRERG